jgi:transposase/Zn finger protein HypA/HybF involved in hydrogenase expression
MNKRSSPIWLISKDRFLYLINGSNTLSELLVKIGLGPLSGGGYKTLRQRIKEEGIDISDLRNRSKLESAKNKISNNKKKFEEIFRKDSLYKGGNFVLKKVLIEKNIVENKCCLCGVNNMWNAKPLSLQIDHINGDNRDNRIENIRILCPNCHSQTETYSGKAKRFLKTISSVDKIVLEDLLKKYSIRDASKILRISHYTIIKLIKYYNIKYERKSSRNKKIRRKFNVSLEQLKILINEKPMTEIGKMFGVSSNAIKKRCRAMGLELPKDRRGYWQKIKR